MLQIAFVVCSLLHGGECRDIALSFHSEKQASPFECMLYGQLAIAKWQREHPNWQKKGGYTCGPPSRLVKL